MPIGVEPSSSDLEDNLRGIPPRSAVQELTVPGSEGPRRLRRTDACGAP